MSDHRKINWDKVDEIALALLSLTCDNNQRAWKALDWDIMDRLHEKGWISDPKSKAKSVILTTDGKDKAINVFREEFLIHDDE